MSAADWLAQVDFEPCIDFTDGRWTDENCRKFSHHSRFCLSKLSLRHNMYTWEMTVYILLLFCCRVSHFSPALPSSRRQIYVSINFLFVFHLLSFIFSAPNNFKGLLLRSHVLYRLKHYQSSLADVDNALKSRPSSYKVSFFLLRFTLIAHHAMNKLLAWRRRERNKY